VFTHDLDFSAILALTGANGPSAVQLRTHDVLPDRVGSWVVNVLREHSVELDRGAVVVIDPDTSRIRLLPLS